MTPRFDALGIVTNDLGRSLRFYALLGVDVPKKGVEDHVEVTLPNGLRLMWDSVELMKQLDPAYNQPRGSRIAMAFRCESPAHVDALHSQIVSAGYQSMRAPWDAFWGQRYAQLVDPDGNKVDLFAAM